MTTQTRVLALIQDGAASAYTLTTSQLEQVLAATMGATHGRKSDDPLVLAVEHLRAQVSAVLQARRKVDEQDAAAARALALAAEPTTPSTRPGMGVRPLPPPPPAIPPALALSQDLL
jgi:hypothetical protein